MEHSKPERVLYDVLIVGGGPAGLSAALVLGRARRRVLVCDSAEYRNAVSRAMHGFLTRDGMPPSEFRATAHAELKRYPSVEVRNCKIEDIEKLEPNQQRPDEAADAAVLPKLAQFRSRSSAGEAFLSRKIIIAVGLKDELPPFPGVLDVYGKGLYHCPYCDGWEHRDQNLCVYGITAERGAGLALELLQWTKTVTLLTHGEQDLTAETRARLKRFQIPVEERPIARVRPVGDGIEVDFSTGPSAAHKAMFFCTKAVKPNNLAERLGCEIIQDDIKRALQIAGKTCVPGVYIAGDASRDILQVITAAGEGSAAAISLNGELLRDDGYL